MAGRSTDVISHFAQSIVTSEVEKRYCGRLYEDKEGGQCVVLNNVGKTLYGSLTSLKRDDKCKECFPTQHFWRPRLGIETLTSSSADEPVSNRATEAGQCCAHPTQKKH